MLLEMRNAAPVAGGNRVECVTGKVNLARNCPLSAGHTRTSSRFVSPGGSAKVLAAATWLANHWREAPRTLRSSAWPSSPPAGPSVKAAG